jgi:hypothetical protein
MGFCTGPCCNKAARKAEQAEKDRIFAERKAEFEDFLRRRELRQAEEQAVKTGDFATAFAVVGNVSHREAVERAERREQLDAETRLNRMAEERYR